MRDLPSGPQLESLARELEGKGIDGLPPKERAAAAAMIERCRTIARREAAAGEAALAPIRAALASLYSGDPSGHLAQLAAEIRSSALDAPGERRDRALALLRALTLQKLRESNRRFLTAHGYDPEAR
ncbi:MAG TPA: hypothetical protein VMU06_00710 [Stellaceae bacterium]|nr:hypothetical protein [Stellaceae bacterium]